MQRSAAMVLFNKLMVSILAVSSFAAAQTKTDKTDDVAQRALKLHHSIFTLDTHCDTPMSLGRYDVGVRHERGQGKQDLPRMKEGGLSASCFAVYLGQGPRTADGYVKAKERALATFGQLEAMFKKYPELCEQAYTPADFKRITNTGKRAILVSMENGYSIGIDVNNVNEYYAKGARMMGLVHSSNNDICDSATDRAVSGGTDKGLSEFGKSVVKRMNELGVVIDVSHASDKSFFDTLAISNSPIMASHSSARAICGHARNLSDEMLRALKKNGGVIQLCILSDYIKARKIDPEQKKLQDDLNARIAEFGGYEALREKPGGEALMAEARA
ncbi:MAG: membrane dipeptidase, partial [Holophagales bacterium]|nr:membrane dipeptidase [Holophagales bacterium]